MGTDMDSDDAETLRADFPELLGDCRSVCVPSAPDKLEKLSDLLARLGGDLSPRERRLVFVWSIEEVNGRLRITMGRRNAFGIIDRVRQDIAMSKAARAVRAAEESWTHKPRMMHGTA